MLCRVGEIQNKKYTASQWTWSCKGYQTSASVSCSADRLYTVTVKASSTSGVAQTFASPTVKYLANTSAITLTPNAGYAVDKINAAESTCRATLSTDKLTVTATRVSEDCTVAVDLTQVPAPGQCDTPAVSLTAPTAKLCKVGSPSAATQSGNNWQWSCAGINGHPTPTACTAPVGRLVTHKVVGGGVISDPLSGTTITSQVVAHGGKASFYPKANTGFAAKSVQGCGATMSSSIYGTSASTDVVEANCTVTTTFVTAYTVTASAGSGGTILNALYFGSSSSQVASGNTTQFYVTPSAGYGVDTISGCGGSLSGSIYTTGVITGNCTITGTFKPVVNGVCGSANNQTFTVAPSSNLCSSGTATAVSGTWNWSCNGSGGGSNSACSARIPTYSVSGTTRTLGVDGNPSTEVGGTISQNNPGLVPHGTTAAFAVQANTGFTIASVSGCGGSAFNPNTTSTQTTFTTGAVSSACMVTATFAKILNGACGSITAPSVTAPSAQQCQAGTPSTAVLNSSGSAWEWTCQGANTGTTSNTCTSPRGHEVKHVINGGHGKFRTADDMADITSPVVVAHGTSTAFMLRPDSGYGLDQLKISCPTIPAGGTDSSSISSVNGVHTTTPITRACTVTASFAPSVAGACGSAHTVPSLTAPASQLCATGGTPSVTSSASAWQWTCPGQFAGASANCQAPRQFKVTLLLSGVTAASGSTGITAASTERAVTHGASYTFDIAAGTYQSLHITSSTCSGSALTGQQLASGAVTTDCTIAVERSNVQHASACGSAASTLSLTAPTAQLCAAHNTSSAVTATSNGRAWRWDCTGQNISGSQSCQTPEHVFDVQLVVDGGNGRFSLPSPQAIQSGSTSAFSLLPDAGFGIASVSSTCGGGTHTLVADAAGVFSTQAVGGPCTVTAKFTPLGACGTASNTPSLPRPQGSALCQSGTASAVTNDASSWRWTCQDQALNSQATQCSAPREQANRTLNLHTPDGSQPVSVRLTPSAGDETCSFTAGTLQQTRLLRPEEAQLQAPAGMAFPFGLLAFETEHCEPGSTITIDMTLPEALPSTASYQKWGPTATQLEPHWYALAGASVSGQQVSFQITDGGLGDSDLVRDGRMKDPGGPMTTAAGTTPSQPQLHGIPTLGELTLGLLGLLTAGLGFTRLRRQSVSRA